MWCAPFTLRGYAARGSGCGGARYIRGVAPLNPAPPLSPVARPPPDKATADKGGGVWLLRPPVCVVAGRRAIDRCWPLWGLLVGCCCVVHSHITFVKSGLWCVVGCVFVVCTHNNCYLVVRFVCCFRFVVSGWPSGLVYVFDFFVYIFNIVRFYLTIDIDSFIFCC